MRKFTRKGYGRIYVANKEDIEKVKEIIKEMDEFEYEYLPKELIVSIEEYPRLSYTHKFDTLDLDELTAKCFLKGIYIFCIVDKIEEKESDLNDR